MATLAPCAAKRTAIACPIPDEPPVTSRFLPIRPGMPARRSRGSTVGAVCDTGSPHMRAHAGAVPSTQPGCDGRPSPARGCAPAQITRADQPAAGGALPSARAASRGLVVVVQFGGHPAREIALDAVLVGERVDAGQALGRQLSRADVDV